MKINAVKIQKLEGLTADMERLWNIKTEVMLVIIGATDTISKSLKTIPGQHTRKHEIKEPHKSSILGTAHILQKSKIEVK